MKEFSTKTIEKIGYYVYLLLDPRNNKIFYVGKGKGNRLFDHISGALENPTETEKIKLIKEIINEKGEVKHASYPRNPIMANVFFKAGLIETWGRGK